jgi:hypothetical protein
MRLSEAVKKLNKRLDGVLEENPNDEEVRFYSVTIGIGPCFVTKFSMGTDEGESGKVSQEMIEGARKDNLRQIINGQRQHIIKYINEFKHLNEKKKREREEKNVDPNAETSTDDGALNKKAKKDLEVITDENDDFFERS